MGYNLKSSYSGTEELTSADRAIAVLYGRQPDALGGNLLPIAIDAAGNLTLGASVTLNVSEVTPVLVEQENPALLQATVSGTVSTTLHTSTSATCSNVSGSASSTTLFAANSFRKAGTVYNDSTDPSAVLFLKFGINASTSSFTVKVPAGGYYELPSPIFVGPVTGVWSSSTSATARVTEFI